MVEYSDDFKAAIASYTTGNPADRGGAVEMETSTKLGYAHSFFDFCEAQGYLSLQGKRFIEVGCGTGFVSTAARTRGATVSTTDVVPACVELARRRFAEHDLSGDFFQSDLRDPVAPQRLAAFDFVWCFQVLEHIPRADQFKALANLFDMVAPGGLLFIDTENSLCPYDSHDTNMWLVRLLSPKYQHDLIRSLGAGLVFFEPSHGKHVQLRDYLSYDEIIGAAAVKNFSVVNPFMPHVDGRQMLRVVTGSDWLHDNVLKYFPFERFSRISVLLRKSE